MVNKFKAKAIAVIFLRYNNTLYVVFIKNKAFLCMYPESSMKVYDRKIKMDNFNSKCFVTSYTNINNTAITRKLNYLTGNRI